VVGRGGDRARDDLGRSVIAAHRVYGDGGWLRAIGWWGVL
jgi:hypothetical protein